MGWALDQLLGWQELLWRKLKDRACPSFPLGVVFQLRVSSGFSCAKLRPPNLDLGPDPLAGLLGWELPCHWGLTGWLLGCVWPCLLSPALPLTCCSTSQLLGGVSAPTHLLVVLTPHSPSLPHPGGPCCSLTVCPFTGFMYVSDWANAVWGLKIKHGGFYNNCFPRSSMLHSQKLKSSL